jgi:signal transduction histidine kinase
MHPDQFYRRYQDLQRYVAWNEEDAARVRATEALVTPFFVDLIDDFYAEISQHPEAHKVITGGAEQIERLKGTLRAWLADLFSGQYDEQYVARRWRVGLRHVEIGLDQVYTNAALSRLRIGLLRALETAWPGESSESLPTRESVNKLLDLDLAIIEDAYQFVYLERQQRIERLVAIGQMAGGVAHELRNPLNVIKTSVYYLLNAKSASPQKTTEHLERIERQVGLADKVITALSDFAKLPFPEVRPVSVAACVAEALEIAALPPEIQVTINVPADLLSVLADPDQLRIALTNLVRNARDAMPEGGQLSVTAVPVESGVEIAISDTGVGIPPESLSRIMEPLFSTKVRGLGLGLAITRAIIEKHHGQITVASQQGSMVMNASKGSTFTVRLPAVPK